MDDLISRQVVLKDLEEYLVNPDTAISVHPDDIHNYNSGLLTAIQAVTDTPSTQLERKKGDWIDEPNCWYRCSHCGTHYPSIIGAIEYNFCPNCGADMRGDGKNDLP